MTANTEQERAEFDAWMDETGPRLNTTERKPDGRYWSSHTQLMWDAWQAARRAQVVQSVAGIQGGVIRGNPTFPKPTAPKAAPQPPEAAPVQMPEPLARIEGGILKWHIPDSRYSLPVRYLQGTHNLYTEHQVRQLLADHGIN